MKYELPRKWILIVDDDSSVRHMLSRVLMDEGFAVLTAAGGEEAVGLASTMKLDLVLLDLNMPGINGWQTLEKLDAIQVAIPVVLITALPNQKGTAQKRGVRAVLEKPLDFPHLIETVGQILAGSANTKNST